MCNGVERGVGKGLTKSRDSERQRVKNKGLKYGKTTTDGF